MGYTLHRPITSDIKSIHSVLMKAAGAGQLLPRSLSNLYSHARDFYLLRNTAGETVGCCALALIWEDIAEVRSLYVQDDLRGKGFGRMLVDACLEDARTFGVTRVFTLTYKTDFFARMGFDLVSKDTLPQKIWADCLQCPKFPDCDEIAMQYVLSRV